jgi:hypothetical protein
MKALQIVTIPTTLFAFNRSRGQNPSLLAEIAIVATSLVAHWSRGRKISKWRNVLIVTAVGALHVPKVIRGAASKVS